MRPYAKTCLHQSQELKNKQYWSSDNWNLLSMPIPTLSWSDVIVRTVCTLYRCMFVDVGAHIWSCNVLNQDVQASLCLEKREDIWSCSDGLELWTQTVTLGVEKIKTSRSFNPCRCPPELEEHAALLLPLCDHLEGVQAAVASVAVPAAERDERAVEAVVPGAVLIHVPQTVLICTDCKTNVTLQGRSRWSKRLQLVLWRLYCPLFDLSLSLSLTNMLLFYRTFAKWGNASTYRYCFVLPWGEHLYLYWRCTSSFRPLQSNGSRLNTVIIHHSLIHCGRRWKVIRWIIKNNPFFIVLRQLRNIFFDHLVYNNTALNQNYDLWSYIPVAQRLADWLRYIWHIVCHKNKHIASHPLSWKELVWLCFSQHSISGTSNDSPLTATLVEGF